MKLQTFINLSSFPMRNISFIFIIFSVSLMWVISNSDLYMRKGVILFVLAFFSITAIKAGDNIIGKWKTIDDVTGEVKSIVDITIKDGKAYGKIIKLFNEDFNYDPVCTACKGRFKKNKIIGMQIINGLNLKEDKWVGKKGILDPDNGKLYNCKLWVDEENENKLNVRGYIGFFYRSQTWLKEK